MAIVSGIWLLGLGALALCNSRSWRAPGWTSIVLLLGAAAAATVVSRRGFAEEDGATLPEALAIGAATLAYLLMALIGFWSSGDQRTLFLLLVVLFTLALLAFVGLHLMTLRSEPADPGVGRRLLLLVAGALARTPVVLLWAVLILLLIAAGMFLLTPHGLDLSWLF